MPTKFVALSDQMSVGVPRLEMNRLNAFINDSTVKYNTNSKYDLFIQIKIDISEIEQIETAYLAILSSNNIYNILKNKENSLSDKNIKPVIKYYNNYIRELLYRKRNKLTYQIYKLNIINILKNRNQFILKKHYI